MFTVDDRVEWMVNGVTYTGVVVGIVGPDAVINDPGDLLVRPDGECYTVTVTPERARKLS